MLKIEDSILLNKFAQGLTTNNELVTSFSNYKLDQKIAYLEEIIALIIQTRPQEEDIEFSIQESGLKPTVTPCVLLRKGLASHNLKKISSLKEDELNKSLLLLLSLFKVSYQRRYNQEKNHPHKWWYWDMADEKILDKINKLYS